MKDLWEYNDMDEEDGAWPECRVEPVRGLLWALGVEIALLVFGMFVWWVWA